MAHLKIVYPLYKLYLMVSKRLSGNCVHIVYCVHIMQIVYTFTQKRNYWLASDSQDCVHIVRKTQINSYY